MMSVRTRRGEWLRPVLGPGVAAFLVLCAPRFHATRCGFGPHRACLENQRAIENGLEVYRQDQSGAVAARNLRDLLPILVAGRDPGQRDPSSDHTFLTPAGVRCVVHGRASGRTVSGVAAPGP